MSESGIANEIVAGRYRLKGKIGEGGFGSVYEADDPQFRGRVALKFLDMGEVKPGSTELSRFENEAKLLAQIRHSNVVEVYDFGVHGLTPYIVMEYLEGADLKQRLKEGPLDISTAFELFSGALEGLAAAHKRGLVHKDIKPANLFIDARGTGRMVVVDYGVGASPERRITAAGNIVGTPAYTPPEYITDSIVAPQNDVYQFALTMIESFTGQKVVAGETTFEVLQAHVNANHRIPDTFKSHPWYDVLMRAISRDLNVRYRDAAEFLEALTAAHHASAVTQEQTDLQDTRVEPDRSEAPTIRDRSDPPKPRRRRTWVPVVGCGFVSVAGIVFACALLAVIVVSYSKSRPRSNAPSRTVTARFPDALQGSVLEFNGKVYAKLTNKSDHVLSKIDVRLDRKHESEPDSTRISNVLLFKAPLAPGDTVVWSRDLPRRVTGVHADFTIGKRESSVPHRQPLDLLYETDENPKYKLKATLRGRPARTVEIRNDDPNAAEVIWLRIDYVDDRGSIVESKPVELVSPPMRLEPKEVRTIRLSRRARDAKLRASVVVER